uniref:Uncharacterized protein n=1 Tax=Anopheles epiroticus TaxID=199890 RepID=A0A182PQE8_9DIPT
MDRFTSLAVLVLCLTVGVASQNRYTYDRGCALQLNTYDSTCRSLAGNSGEAYCEFCLESLCNY